MAVAAALGWSPPAAAQEDRAAPGTPAGFEYALPLESAREQAAPDGLRAYRQRAVPGAADVVPLFGIGIDPPRPDGDGQASGRASPTESSEHGRTSRAPPSSETDETASSYPLVGGETAIAAPIGIALAVLALGGALAFALRRRPQWRGRTERGLTLGLAAGCGLAPLWHGFYALPTWGTIGLLLIAVLVGLVAAAGPAPAPLGLVALGGLGLLCGWTLLSRRWAESADQALLAADRWLLYAVLLALLLSIVRDSRGARLLVAGGTLATVGFAGYLCVRLALPGSADLFRGGRLEYPLGYVNGQAGHLLLALWPALAVAEVARRPRVAGTALAVAVVLVGLMLLSQARAVALAGVVTGVLLLAVVPGRRRRGWCLLTLALGAALAAGPLLDVYGATSPGARRPDEAALRIAILVLCAAATVAGTAWGMLRRHTDRASARTPRGGARAASGVALALIGFAVATSAAVAVGDPSERARAGIREFKALDADATRESDSRFVSGGGNRYDYWRVAVDQFVERPLTGAGGGNYDIGYFAERRTAEDVRQPHSLPLQLLAEVGLPGLLGALLLVVAALIGLSRRARRAAHDPEERLLTLAAGGTFIAWLAHTSVDWLHLIPGVTGIALCAVAALVVARRPGAGLSVPVPVRGVAVTASVVALIAAALLIAVPLVADRHTAAARQLVADDPVAALRKSEAALRLNGEALPAYYAAAAAHARRGNYRGARAALRAAIAREPSDFVSWALLGDLAVRRGTFGAARVAYAHAVRHNPRDRVLRSLLRDTRGAARRQARVTTAN